jgi:hypothetical protein
MWFCRKIFSDKLFVWSFSPNPPPANKFCGKTRRSRTLGGIFFQKFRGRLGVVGSPRDGRPYIFRGRRAYRAWKVTAINFPPDFRGGPWKYSLIKKFCDQVWWWGVLAGVMLNFCEAFQQCRWHIYRRRCCISCHRLATGLGVAPLERAPKL